MKAHAIPILGRARYTVQRCREDDRRYGPVHLADYWAKTRCGLAVDDKWWIVTTDYSGKATCKRCMKEQTT